MSLYFHLPQYKLDFGRVSNNENKKIWQFESFEKCTELKRPRDVWQMKMYEESTAIES